MGWLDERIRVAMIDDLDPYIDGNVSPGFEHRGNAAPIESLYQTPTDPSAPHECCMLDVLVEQVEFTWRAWCHVHGETSGGNAD
jgi:hypothetical protein